MSAARLSSRASVRESTGTPVLDVETRFMQNYRVAAPVSAGTQIAAVRNGAGDVEIFSLASDGTIWNFYPDPASESGYTGVPTGLSGSTFGVGRDSDGRIVLFVASLLTLTYVKETGGTPRWGTPATVSYPVPQNATRIAQIVVDDIADQLYVALLVQYTSITGPLYALVYSVWSDASPTFVRANAMNLGSTNSAWLGNTPATAAFVSLQTTVVSYDVTTGLAHAYPMAPFDSISVSAAVDGKGSSQVFSVLADGNVYQLIGGQGGVPYSWAQLTRGMTFRQVGTATDAAGGVHVFAVSGDNRLFHWEPDGSAQTGYGDGTVLATALAQAVVAADDGGGIDVFAAGTAQATLTHIFQEELSTNWTAQTVEVPSGGAVEQYVSYTSDVTVHDATGALLANVPVTITAAEETRVSVNGAVYFTGPGHPIRTSTNAAGTLSLAQETGSLAIPALGLNVTGYMPSGQTLAVEQSAVVQARLGGTTGPDLMTATVAGGGYLLADKYRTKATTDGLASALQQCMSLPAQPASRVEPLAGIRRSNTGVGLVRDGSIRHLSRLSTPPPEQHWRLVFDGDAVRYEELSAEHAAALVAARRATLPSAYGIFDWLSDVGDFFAGVVDGAIEIVEAIVTTVVDGVQAVFTAIIDGVTYLFEAVVDAVEQAFDFVEAVFAQVKVAFEQLFEWIGFLFDWPDILRSHEAIAYAVNEFVSFLGGAATGVQRIVDDGLANVQARIDALFDEAVAQIAGQQSIGGFDRTNTPAAPEFYAAAANNVVLNGLVDNVNGATLAGGATALLLADGPLQSVIDQLEQFARTIENSGAFGDSQSYFTTLGGSPDEIFSQLLATLLRLGQAVTKVAVAGLQAVVDALLGIVASLVGAMQDLLNQPWDIPLVSDLYSWVTDGSQLTLLDLVALVVAIPATIVYKAAYGAAPFPTDASVAEFKAAFDAPRMLQASGLGAPGEADVALADGGGIVLPVGMQRFLAAMAGLAVIGYGLSSAVNDAFPKDAPPVISKVCWGFELAVQGATFPWFYTSGAPDCSTSDGKSKTLWIQTCVGVGLDTAYLKFGERLPENRDDIGVCVTFVYGLGHLVTAIVASVGQSGAPVALNLLPVFPELGKLLRLTVVIAATESISLAVIAGLDFVCYTAVGALTAISVPSAALAAASS